MRRGNHNSAAVLEVLESRLLLSASADLCRSAGLVAAGATAGSNFALAKPTRLGPTGALKLRGSVDGYQLDFYRFRPAAAGTVRLHASDEDAVLAAWNEGSRKIAFGAGIDVSFDVLKGRLYYIRLSRQRGSPRHLSYALTVRQSLSPPDVQGDARPAGAVTAYVVTAGGGRQLVVAGTNGPDEITVTGAGDLTVRSDDGTSVWANISSLAVYGFGGSDVIRLANAVTADGLLDGGDGNDQLFALGRGLAGLRGGDGADLLVAIGGRGGDWLDGQGGADSYWLDAGDAIANADAAESGPRAIHRITEFYQPYSRDRSSPRYVSLELGGQDLDDPDAGGAGYRDFSDVPLFVGGAGFSDIDQGGVGDCYLLASLASLADQDPDLIEQMIAPLGDGTYAVRFYRNGQPVYLRLDADLPATRYGSLIYAGLGESGELWAALAEKAYAYFRYGDNSYDSLNMGWMSDVYEDVTGAATDSLYTGLSSGELLNFIAGCLADGHAVTMGSYSSASGPVVGCHAYMVKSVQPEGQLVTVYNPWGIDGGSGTDGNYSDGLVTLTIQQVARYFSTVVVSLA